MDYLISLITENPEKVSLIGNSKKLLPPVTVIGAVSSIVLVLLNDDPWLLIVIAGAGLVGV